jgi:hypothetical protein
VAPNTGTWALGKTIGAGSMGKVKLAKNVASGEQVCRISASFFLVGLRIADAAGFRSP